MVWWRWIVARLHALWVRVGPRGAAVGSEDRGSTAARPDPEGMRRLQALFVSPQSIVDRISRVMEPGMCDVEVFDNMQTPLGMQPVLHLPRANLTYALPTPWCVTCVAARKCPGAAFRKVTERN